MNVLSLFDGVSCARIALERAGIDVGMYYASEIDKYAIKVTQANRPDTIQMGDVKNVHGTTESWVYNARDGHLLKGVGKDFDIKFDLLIGGSPCQDLSIAKSGRKGLDGERSGLFWEYVRILKEVQPKYFILENVASMPKESKQVITDTLGVEPIMINAALVSAQNRKRLFWVGKRNEVGKYTQVHLELPYDRHIYLKDILETDVDDSFFVQGAALRNRGNGKKPEFNGTEKANALTSVQTDSMVRIGDIGSTVQSQRVYSPEGKSVALSALGGGHGAKTGLYMIQTPRGTNKGGIVASDGKTPSMTISKWEHNNKLVDGHIIRKLTPIECERLQGMTDNWTNPTGDISNSQRYKMCGNAFNVDVVAHILNFIKYDNNKV